jgi:hypothetical protein
MGIRVGVGGGAMQWIGYILKMVTTVYAEMGQPQHNTWLNTESQKYIIVILHSACHPVQLVDDCVFSFVVYIMK